MSTVFRRITKQLLSVVFSLGLVTGALVRAEEPKSNHSSRRNNGSATVLSGSVLLYHIYVSDEASSWTGPQKKEIQRRLDTALKFIATEAGKYDITLRVIQERAADVRCGKTIPTAMFSDPQWTEEAIRAAGARSANDLAAQLKERYKVDHVLFALHVNKAALSNNLTYYDHVDCTYAAERIICYDRYPDGRSTAAASYAHEILHSFGAGELYFPFDKNEDRKKIARGLFPDDVMLRVDYDIEKLDIGRYTAYRIGWIDTLQPEHRVFEDGEMRRNGS